MTLDDIRKEIERDVRLDDTALDLEALKIPQLHGKYLNFLTDEKLAMSKYEFDEELTARGWEPFSLKILRNDLDLYLESDADLAKLQQKVVYQKEKIALLEEIVKELNNRHWKIRCAIDWRKFVNGQ